MLKFVNLLSLQIDYTEFPPLSRSAPALHMMQWPVEASRHAPKEEKERDSKHLPRLRVEDWVYVSVSPRRRSRAEPINPIRQRAHGRWEWEVERRVRNPGSCSWLTSLLSFDWSFAQEQ